MRAFWQSTLVVIESLMSIDNPITRAIWLNEGLRRPIADLAEEYASEAN